MTPAELTDLTTAEEVEKLLDGTTPGPWLREAQGIYADNGHKLIASVKSHEHGIAWPTTEANGNIMAAAPNLARTVIALHAQLADAEARGMEMALKTYRTGAGVDNGNYPLWAYDADYETAVRKKAEVHRKAASDRATRKDI